MNDTLFWFGKSAGDYPIRFFLVDRYPKIFHTPNKDIRSSKWQQFNEFCDKKACLLDRAILRRSLISGLAGNEKRYDERRARI